ncbi:MAG TPA: serine hydrolase [Ktedonobacteraceae bacterium]
MLRSARAKRRISRFSAFRLIALLTLCALGALVSVFFAWHIPRAQAQTKAPAHHISAQKSRDKSIAMAQRSGNTQTLAPIATLSSSLSSYLSTLGPHAGVVVYDVTHQRTYSSNSAEQFLTASSIKVPIMLTFFAMTESQGREPDDAEVNLLTAMIEHSDNDAASALFAEINGATGIASYLQQIGVSGLAPDEDAWGYSLITPQAMVDLLTRLQNGTILTATDRASALGLMQNVESDQQWGVGDTAPAGATFAMKNGWVPGPDGLWSVNSSGIVNAGAETYIISVYMQEQPSLAAGQAILQQVCSQVVSSLMGS